MPGKVSKPRNRELISGINAVGRSLSSKLKKRNLFKVRGPNPDQKKTAKPVAHTAQLARFYAADDVKTPVPSRKNHRKPTALRASITPGTVLILLAGRFRGRRVVFLKQLASGLLLVTGPYKINGVPLRRVNQRYVIATSTKVDIKGVDTKKVSDHFFARAVAEKPKKNADNFFTENAKKKELSKERREAQLTVDKALLASIKKVENLSDYLRARFSLTKGQYPHLLKF